MKKLRRLKQCAKCPWKVSTDPHEIPDGYCELKHANLKNTIADPENPLANIFDTEIHIMACHHSTPSCQMHCIGWLHNQLGAGNNILLRLQMREYENVGDIKVVGEQHQSFNDTLPCTEPV